MITVASIKIELLVIIYQQSCQQTFKRSPQFVFVSLSDMLQPIHLFRYDPLQKQIYILAGINEGIEIIIFENGKWEFYNDDET